MKYTSQSYLTPTIEMIFIDVERGFEVSQTTLEDMLERPEQNW